MRKRISKRPRSCFLTSAVVLFFILSFVPDVSAQTAPKLDGIGLPPKYRAYAEKALAEKLRERDVQKERVNASLSERKVPIVRHEPGVTGVRFVEGDNPSAQEIYSALGVSEKDLDTYGAQHMRTMEERLKKIVDLPKLPNCKRAATYPLRLYQSTLGAQEAFDYVFYSPSDPKQRRKAKTMGNKAVPYEGGEAYNMLRPSSDPRVAMAVMARVTCLPTHLQIVDVREGRFLLYRMGDNAWLGLNEGKEKPQEKNKQGKVKGKGSRR